MGNCFDTQMLFYIQKILIKHMGLHVTMQDGVKLKLDCKDFIVTEGRGHQPPRLVTPQPPVIMKSQRQSMTV